MSLIITSNFSSMTRLVPMNANIAYAPGEGLTIVAAVFEIHGFANTVFSIAVAESDFLEAFPKAVRVDNIGPT